jgi:hypothetical protein
MQVEAEAEVENEVDRPAAAARILFTPALKATEYGRSFPQP